MSWVRLDRAFEALQGVRHAGTFRAGACECVSHGHAVASGGAVFAKWAWCVNQGGTFSTDQRMNGCSSIIQSGRESRRNLAIAYYSRGLAYYDKGDDDRAIADYNEALRLDPKYAYAYSSRGLAYDHKIGWGIVRVEPAPADLTQKLV